MKTASWSTLLFSLFALFTIISCGDECTEVRDFVRYEPVYIDQAEYDKAIAFEATKDIESPGAIASYGSYLFINDYNSGVHIINNEDPANPIQEGFIAINNSKHFAVKDGILLANRYNDLVAVDIRNTNGIKEVERISNVFPDEAEVTSEGIISHYIRTEERMQKSCEDAFNGDWWMEGDDIFMSTQTFSGDVMSTTERNITTNQGSSTSSSAAKFTLAKSRLYVLNGTQLEVFDVTNAAAPVQVNTTQVGWGVETLFPLNDYLFTGANNGMTIYDLSDPSSPSRISSFEHADACDPVVANESFAYVTLRSGTGCQGFTNQLDVVDIRNINNPTRISTHELSNPRGLALMGDHLVVCDGDDGVVVFNVRDENNPQIVSRFSQEHANDVLPISETIAVVSGQNGVYELDLSDIANPALLSVIAR